MVKKLNEKVFTVLLLLLLLLRKTLAKMSARALNLISQEENPPQKPCLSFNFVR